MTPRRNLDLTILTVLLQQTLASWTVPEMVLSNTESSDTSATNLTTISTPMPTITIRPLEIVSGSANDIILGMDSKHNNPMFEESYFDSSMKPTHTAYLGKTATLTCIVHAAKTDKSVSWIRSRDLRILIVGRYTYTSDLRFEAIHTEGSSEWTVRIKSVQLRDQGNYECQIATKPIRTFTVTLNVVEPTVEILGSPDLFVNRASMINLTCIVHHAPFPPEAITWYHNNETISYTSSRGGVSVVEERGETTTSFLLLQNAQSTDTGLFICKPDGLEAAVVTLHVLDGEHPAAMQTNGGSFVSSNLSPITKVTITIFLYRVLR